LSLTGCGEEIARSAEEEEVEEEKEEVEEEDEEEKEEEAGETPELPMAEAADSGSLLSTSATNLKRHSRTSCCLSLSFDPYSFTSRSKRRVGSTSRPSVQGVETAAVSLRSSQRGHSPAATRYPIEQDVRQRTHPRGRGG